MKKNITYLCMAAAALLVSSCTQNEEITPTIENEGRVPVLFTAKNSAVLETKVGGNWYGYTEVGITMLAADDSKVYNQNVQFENEEGTDNAALTPSFGDKYKIYYPTDGSNVKFNAYTPYETNSGTITWNFADRDGEYFYTATTEGDGNTYNQETGLTQTVSLDFKNRLSQIIISVESSDYDVKKILSGTLSNHPTSFTYNVATGEITQGEKGEQKNGFTTNKGEVRFTILPEGITQQETITIPVTEDVSFEATLPYPEGGFKTGILYKYKTTLNKKKTEGTFQATIDALGTQDMGTIEATEKISE